MDKDKELVVLDLMMVAHLKLLSVQNGVIVNVLNISLGDLSVDLDFLSKQDREDLTGKDQEEKAIWEGQAN